MFLIIKMCWNKETSLISFILGTVINIGVLLYMKKEEVTIICIIWQFILLMQLAEYFIWLDSKCGKTNEKGTKAALILNLTQPIIVFIVLISKFTGSQTLKIISSVIIFIYICYMMLKLNEYPTYKCVQQLDKCPHLNFQWWRDFSGAGMLYVITLISIILMLYKPLKTSIFISVYILLMLVLSQKFYSCGQPSMWCWMVVPMPLFLLLFYKLTNK
jgi:hypothetical protein